MLGVGGSWFMKPGLLHVRNFFLFRFIGWALSVISRVIQPTVSTFGGSFEGFFRKVRHIAFDAAGGGGVGGTSFWSAQSFGIDGIELLLGCVVWEEKYLLCS